MDFSIKNNSLVLAELRKWLITPGMILVCSLAALGICIVRFPITETKADLESIYYKSYVEEVSGIYSQEKMEKLNGYLDRISDYELELMLVSDDTPQVLKDQYMSEIDKKDGLLKAIDYAYYLQENEKRYFVYDQGYKVMFGFEQGKLPFFVYRIISAAAMVLIAWYLFAQEKKTGMEKLITISSVGRKRVSTAKYINLFLTSITVSLVVWSAWVFQVSHTFNIEYLYAPASSLKFLSFLPEYISIGMALVIYFVLQWLYTFFLGALTGWLSSFSLNENVKLVLMLLAAVSLPVILMCL